MLRLQTHALQARGTNRDSLKIQLAVNQLREQPFYNLCLQTISNGTLEHLIAQQTQLWVCALRVHVWKV